MTKEPFLKAVGIRKEFPGVLALNDVSIECYPGETLGVLGENGAGKSTLMKIFTGMYHPDKGDLFVDGKKLSISSPAFAQRQGISMVYQDTRLVPDLTVMQNIWLGHEPSRFSFVNKKTMLKKTNELLKEFDIHINPKSYVRDLSVAQKQLVEIIKALSHDTKLLILDEPTSALTPAEFKKLALILDDIKKQGTSILFISHRIVEVLSACDRFVVLKDGQLAGELPKEEANEQSLVKMMVGREIKKMYGEEDECRQAGDVVLKVDNISNGSRFSDISFELKKGEILGIGGIEGNGQRDIVQALAGLAKIEKGDIFVDGEKADIRTPWHSISRKISYLSNDRRGQSIFLSLNLKENMSIPNLSKLSKFGVMKLRAEDKAFKDSVDSLKIKQAGHRQTIEQLSGGNQQKIALGARLIQEPQIFIFDDPTVGIDVATKSEIYKLIKRLANRGIGVIVLSSDLPELIGLSDRILVLSKGKITKELQGDKATEEDIISAAVTDLKTEEPDCKTQEIDSKTENKAACKSGNINETSHRIGIKATNFERWSSSIVVFMFILLIGICSSVYSPYFTAPDNLSNIALAFIPFALVALGQSFPILLGGIDLSVGPLMSLITAVASYTMAADQYGFGLILCLLIGIAVGVINGIIIAFLKIPDMVTTLATYSIMMGLALVVRPTGGGSISYGFIELINTRILMYIPVFTLLVILLYVVLEILLLRSKPGTYLYATGSSTEAAYIAGIKIKLVRISAYALSGFFAALAGLVLASRIGAGDPMVGTSFTMASITAVVIGGISMTGGRGVLSGTFLGALLIVLMQNALNMLRISAYFQYVWVGTLTILAVSLYNLPKIINHFKKDASFRSTK